MSKLDNPPDGVPANCPEADDDSESEDEAYHESESEEEEEDDDDEEEENSDTEVPTPPWIRESIRDSNGNLTQIIYPDRRLREFYTGTAPNEMLQSAVIVERMHEQHSDETIREEYIYDTDPAYIGTVDRSTNLYRATLRKVVEWEWRTAANRYVNVYERTFGPPIVVDGQLRDHPTLLTTTCGDNSLHSVIHYDEVSAAKRMMTFPSGNAHIYEGRRGRERLVEARSVTHQHTRYFEGEKGHERCTMTKYDDGRGKYFVGPRDEERCWKMDWPSGTYQLLSGPRGEEQVYYVNYAVTNVAETWYAPTHIGPRIERMKMRNGTMKYFEGPKGDERLVAKQVPGRGRILYTGQRGRERPMTREEIEAMQIEGTGGEHRTLRRSERVRAARAPRAEPY